MMKKTWAGFIILLMAVTVSACGKNPVSDGEKTTAQDESYRYNEITMEIKETEMVEAGTNSFYQKSHLQKLWRQF